MSPKHFPFRWPEPESKVLGPELEISFSLDGRCYTRTSYRDTESIRELGQCRILQNRHWVVSGVWIYFSLGEPLGVACRARGFCSMLCRPCLEPGSDAGKPVLRQPHFENFMRLVQYAAVPATLF
ncbi:hypothetical protein AK812_SmicGene33614 [Symbiodinium microadriaticum]|uniref:Uncharacterized protein n=1 Tax=Symbiodinium microadriaticum TaxID=2951 RepID=A0A1Q9CR57_SYMMI|nr:hypothetical protein AK812_SmicGene33614 [Symbiodinium microadriaticum]